MQKFFILSLLFFLSLSARGQDFKLPSISITNEEKINSPLLEFSPSFFEDGILFVSTMSSGKKYTGFDKKINKPTMSIFLARRDDITGRLSHPQPFALELTTRMHEGPLTFDRNAEKVYYTRNDLKKRRRKPAKLKIYESIKEKDGSWSLPAELPFNLDDYETAHPTISADGNTMIFSSNRPGGFGGMDLYIVWQNAGVWTEPVNMGPNINTDKNELFPFLHADNSLFFSSNGHNSTGGLDIFYSAPDTSDTYYSLPVNIGAPFNSEKDDFGLIVDRDKKNGYFSSNRTGGAGEDDIYAFNVADGNLDDFLYFKDRLPKTIDPVTFLVKDKKTYSPVDDFKIYLLPLNDKAITPDMLTRVGSKIALLPDKAGPAKQAAMERGTALVTSNGIAKAVLPKGLYVTYTKNRNYSEILDVFSTGKRQITLLPDFSINCIPIHGRLTEIRSNTGIPNATVQVVLDGQVIEYVSTDDSGNFNTCVKCGKDYHFVASYNGTKIGEEKLSTQDSLCYTTSSYNVLVSAGDLTARMSEGSVIELKNLYFNFNDASIRPDARKELDALVEVMQAYPDMEIEIASYTDAVGSEEYNLRISQKRADKVAQYLISKGISEDRILPVGYGESGIRNRCTNGVKCADYEHQYNRRIEIKVTKSSVPVKVISNAPPADDAFTSSNETASAADDETVASSSEDFSEYNTFHVVIGAFLREKNAEKKARQARRLGFDETVITSFEDTPAYNSVIVKSFDNYDEALDFAKMLKREYGFKYYIKKM